MENLSAIPAAPAIIPIAPRSRPRPVARAFAGYFLAILLGSAGTVVLFLSISNLRDLGSAQNGAATILLLSVPLQLALLVVAFLLGREPGERTRRRLGLVAPRLNTRGWMILLGATGVPFALSLCAAATMPSFQDPSVLVRIWNDLTPLAAVGWVVFIGVVPGVCEEVFFRGFMQRHLLKAWKPTTSIVVTSVLFGLMHIDPQAIALATMLGLWLGFVAWRTGSILPTIAMHAMVNSGWNAAQIIARKSELPPQQAWAAVAVVAAVSLVCFFFAVPIFTSRRARPGRETHQPALAS